MTFNGLNSLTGCVKASCKINKMSKHKVFVPDENILLNSSSEKRMTCTKSGSLHPALSGSVEQVKTSCDRPTYAKPNETMKISNPVFGDDADSDLDPIPVLFSSSNQKLPYTKQEDELILKYVLKGQNIFRVTSILLWKHLEAKKENPRRTYQSLKNRFLRNIKPYMFSTYRYLIKDKETVEKILSKFPELKRHLGTREVLSGLNCLERKSPSKSSEQDGESNSSTNEFEVGAEMRKKKLRKLDEANLAVHLKSTQHEKLMEDEPEFLGPDFFRSVIYEREVNTNRGNLIVRVDLKSKSAEASVSSSSLGIYDKFKKMKDGNKLVFCPTCGRYNRPKENTLMKSSDETDIIIPNSVETSKSESKDFRKVRWSLRLRGTRTSSHKIHSTSESSIRTPCSPGLLTNASEGDKINKPASDLAEDSDGVPQSVETSERRILRSNANEDVCNKQEAKSNSFNSKNKTNNSRRSNTAVPETSRKAKEVSNSKSHKKSNSMTAKRSRNNDTNFDSICEEAMENFRKLIDHEEEKQLVRKCLNKNFKSIGLEAVSQMNLDSYFLESSSDMESTPPLTIDFDANTGSYENKERSSGSATAS